MACIDRKKIGMPVIVTLLIVVAIACRFMNKFYFDPDNALLSCLRSLIYIGLFVAWGISVHRRIIQARVRCYLMIISMLMVFWLTIRAIKYSVVTDLNVERYLWYLYYVGMLLIPLLSLLVSISLGKTETFRLPKWTALLYVFTITLLVLVLTNDLHQMVFRFPAGAPVFTDSDYGYAALYWPVIGWEIGCALSAIIVIIRKCRIPNSRKMLWLPLVPMLVSILYGVLYASEVGWLRMIAGDITAFQCLFYTAVLESCIQCGLIQSNTNYKELFRISTIGAQITDDTFNVCYSAENARLVGKEIFESATVSPFIFHDGIRLSETPIWGGHVFWQENISDLLDTIEQLSGIREELKSYGSLLQEENKKKARVQKLTEQKRLYAQMREKTANHVELVEILGTRLQKTDNVNEARKLLAQILTVGAYIKRRSNLIFLADEAGEVSANELLLCLNEAMANLRLLGVKCACSLDFAGSMNGDCAGAAFDFYETVVENAFHTLHALSVSVARMAGGYSISLMMDCEDDITGVLKEQFSNAGICRQDGVWFCSLSVSDGRVEK